MSDYDYLKVEQEDKAVLKNLSSMGEMLKNLKVKMLEAQELAEKAKKEYEHYANNVLPNEMAAMGVDSISLSSGGRLLINRKFYCQPNKNDADKKIISDWLRAHGGEHLIKEQAIVGTEDVGQLKEAGIPYVEKSDVNTNSLKAFLKSGLGVDTGVQQFTLEDIPACIHFQQVLTVEVEV